MFYLADLVAGKIQAEILTMNAIIFIDNETEPQAALLGAPL